MYHKCNTKNYFLCRGWLEPRRKLTVRCLVDSITNRRIPAGNVGIVGAFGEEVADIPVQERVIEGRTYLVHRDKDEPAEVGTWMRDGQERRVHVFLFVEKQV